MAVAGTAERDQENEHAEQAERRCGCVRKDEVVVVGIKATAAVIAVARAAPSGPTKMRART